MFLTKKYRPLFWFDGDDKQGSGDDKKSDEKKFTQDEVNRIAGERAQRAEQSALTKFFESLGVKDSDELKSKVAKWGELEKNQLTEKERLEKELADEKQKREDAEKKREEMKLRANEKLIRAAFITEASKAAYNFQDAAIPDLWVLLTKEQRESLKLKDDDSVENVEKVLKELTESKKHLLKPSKPRGAGTPMPNASGSANEPDAVAAYMNKAYGNKKE